MRPLASLDVHGGPAYSEAEFVRLVEPELRHAYHLALMLLRNAATAEDVVQTAILRAWAGWPTLRDRDRFVPWFHSILINACRDELRPRGRIRWLPLDQVSIIAPDGLDSALDRDVIGRAFTVLPLPEQEVLALRFWADLTVAEIASRVGAPVGTVKSRLHSALRRMRAAVEEAGQGTA
jgi:RNA polymerase sigma factor (sigma-70 family)